MAVVNRRKVLTIFIIAALFCALFLFSGCNPGDNTVDISQGIKEPSHFMAKFLIVLNEKVGNFGWTVVVFTIILKVILSPFDFWQKHITRKNAKIMERIKPRLEELKAKFGEDKARFNQEQMALYKREKYSTFGACLPSLLTLVVFFVVFSGFSQMVAYKNGQVYERAQATYFSAYADEYQAKYDELYDALSEEQTQDAQIISQTEASAHYYAVDAAQTAVAQSYQMESFLWIKNIFVQDAWNKPVPDYTTFSGQTGFAQARVSGVAVSEYETVMGKVLGKYGYAKNGGWNGLLILPALSLVLNFLSQKILMKAQGSQPPTSAAGGAASQKMMQYMMPALMGIFSLLYSSAFTLYIFVGAVFTIAFQLVYNLIAALYDKAKLKPAATGKIR
jgi:YidC/Oxa1 family membrane protein insertase